MTGTPNNGPSVNYWQPHGMPFAVGMALHRMDESRCWWSQATEALQAEHERRYPNNRFTQNARQADDLMLLHRVARAMPCHDRPESIARLGGAYGRPDGALTQPHALWAMEAR